MARFRTCATEDLAAAEDLAAVLAKALDAMLTDSGFVADAKAVDALAEFSGYCRPSCRYLDDGECHSPDPATCGCICGHSDELDPLSRDELRPHIDYPPVPSLS